MQIQNMKIPTITNTATPGFLPISFKLAICCVGVCTIRISDSGRTLHCFAQRSLPIDVQHESLLDCTKVHTVRTRPSSHAHRATLRSMISMYDSRVWGLSAGLSTRPLQILQFRDIHAFQVTLAHSLSWNNGQWLPIENLVWTQRQPRAPQQRKFLVQSLCCQIYAAKCWIGKCSLSTLTNLRLKHSTCANEFCKFACARGGVPCTGWSSRPVWLFFWLNKKSING